MPELEHKHNANLLNTLPNHTPIVNFIERDEEGVAVVYNSENAPDKLFVKIDNNINDQGLSPRQIEFYCQLMYLIIAYPKVKLSILKIQSLIIKYTNQHINKNTINNYLNILIIKGLLSRTSNSFLIAHRVKSKAELCNPKKYTNTNTDNILESLNGKEAEVTSNQYHDPKTCFTPFYILAYNQNTARFSLVLELYFASKPYNRHRPTLVCKELNITRKTYYKYLKELIEKKIILKEVKNYNTNHYHNTNRLRLKEESEHIQDHRKFEREDAWYESRKLKREQLASGQITKTAHSRLWYASPMGLIMDEYMINYIPAFNNYDPDDAYKIVQFMFQKHGKNISAAYIVSAIKNDYNWITIKDREHAKLKREEAKLEVFTFTARHY